MKHRMEAAYAADCYLDETVKLCWEARDSMEAEVAFLLRTGLNKELQDEMIPIGYFCRQYFKVRPDLVAVNLVLGNQTFDAVVADSRPEPCGIDFLEVACIEDTEEHRSRVDMLDGGSSTLRRSVREIFDLMMRVVRKKSPKNYPDNTALLMYSKIVYPIEIYRYFEVECAVEYRKMIDSKFKFAFILDREKIFRL